MVGNNKKLIKIRKMRTWKHFKIVKLFFKLLGMVRYGLMDDQDERMDEGGGRANIDGWIDLKYLPTERSRKNAVFLYSSTRYVYTRRLLAGYFPITNGNPLLTKVGNHNLNNFHEKKHMFFRKNIMIFVSFRTFCESAAECTYYCSVIR